MAHQIACALRRAVPQEKAVDRVTLDHEGRCLRRRTLTTDAGTTLSVDLPEAVSLNDGDAFETADGTLIAVRAAPEPLIEVAAAATDLARLAWHIGNRHALCEIGEGVLRVSADPVLARMLRGLGAQVREVTAPFHPEGGAYGEGRPTGHSHGPDPLRLGGLAHDPP